MSCVMLAASTSDYTCEFTVNLCYAVMLVRAYVDTPTMVPATKLDIITLLTSSINILSQWSFIISSGLNHQNGQLYIKYINLYAHTHVHSVICV